MINIVQYYNKTKVLNYAASFPNSYVDITNNCKKEKKTNCFQNKLHDLTTHDLLYHFL